MLTVNYDTLGIKPGELMLDLGAGFGRHGFEAARRGAKVISCDFAHPEMAQVRATFYAMGEAGEIPHDRNAGCLQGDAQKLPFADNSFDRIIASEVMEHVPSDVAAIGEMARVLKPGGVLAVTVPAFGPERICWALSDDYHAPAVEGGHVRIYTRAQLANSLGMAGLDVYAHHRTHALHSPYWWLRCAVGVRDDHHPLVKRYKRLLEKEIIERPKSLAVVEKALAPVLGKSMVVYGRKPNSSAAGRGAERALIGAASS
jgi:SAM-dependent methyltransferase